MEFQEHKRLIELLPDHLQKYREYRVITETEQTELDHIQLRISNLLSDVFTDTATEEGIAHRESMYGILPTEGASLEERRLAVKTKETHMLPYTIRRYREMLAAMCGEENYLLLVLPGEYRVEVRVRAVKREEQEAETLLSAVDTISRQVLPANLIYVSALFDSHKGLHTTYHGAAVCVRKCYNVEVM